MLNQIEVNYGALTVQFVAIETTKAKTSPKIVKYTNAEKVALSNNAKPLNVILCEIEDDEINIASSFTTVHDAWKALRLGYEGEASVKEQKFHALHTQFEALRMIKSESFDTFYLRLPTVVNHVAGIGHHFVHLTIVRKIMRVWPMKRFDSKIDSIIEVTADIKTLIVNQLVSHLRA